MKAKPRAYAKFLWMLHGRGLNITTLASMCVGSKDGKVKGRAALNKVLLGEREGTRTWDRLEKLLEPAEWDAIRPFAREEWERRSAEMLASDPLAALKAKNSALRDEVAALRRQVEIERDSKTLVYLATPYSHPDALVREERFKAVNRVAAEMMAAGLQVFSPISHTHPIAEAGDLPRGWEYWQAYDRAMLQSCVKLVVLMLDGWRESKGVAGETAIAKELGIPVEYIEPTATKVPRGTNEAQLIETQQKIETPQQAA